MAAFLFVFVPPITAIVVVGWYLEAGALGMLLVAYPIAALWEAVLHILGFGN